MQKRWIELLNGTEVIAAIQLLPGWCKFSHLAHSFVQRGEKIHLISSVPGDMTDEMKKYT